MAVRKKCCVVGAGLAGIVTIKELLAQGIEVTCYDRSDDLAGLWKYRPDVVPGQSSLYDSLYMNSSKEMSCFSDFPMPKSFPNFLHHSFFNHYLQTYADHFDIRKHIQFNSDVLSVVRSEDYETTYNWLVTVRNCLTENKTTKKFDFVVIANGHDFKPSIPYFKGIENFSGSVIHSNNFKRSEDFRNRRVLVIGFGHSGAEISALLAKQSEQVFLSTRSGTYITTRSTKDGQPYDQALYTRFRSSMPFQVQRFLDYQSVRYQNQYGIQPKTRFKPGVKTISDDFLPEMVLGKIIVKPDVDHFTENGVIFKDQTRETIDALILATGYELDLSVIPDLSINNKETVVPDLYKLVFPTSLDPCTIAFVGTLYSIGSRTPTVELQARWVAQVFSGKCQLASVQRRLQWKEARTREIYSNAIPTERKALSVVYIDYLNDIAAEAGCNPKLLLLLFTDPVLWYKVVFKALTPAQWRIHGPDSKPKYAREAIMKLEENNLYPYKGASAGATWKPSRLKTDAATTVLKPLHPSVTYMSEERKGTVLCSPITYEDLTTSSQSIKVDRGQGRAGMAWSRPAFTKQWNYLDFVRRVVRRMIK